MTTPSLVRAALAWRKFRRTAVLAAGALFLAAGAAHGQSAQPVQQTNPLMTEFRGYALVTFAFEDDIWRLTPDSRATLIYVQRRGSSDRDGAGTEGSDVGTWSMRNGQICVAWQFRHDISGCYTIVPMFGIHVRLVGPVVFEGTIERY